MEENKTIRIHLFLIIYFPKKKNKVKQRDVVSINLQFKATFLPAAQPAAGLQAAFLLLLHQ